MARQTITTLNDSPALVLPQEMLAQLGVAIGDDVNVMVVEGMLVVRTPAEAERDQRVAALTQSQSLLERRKQVYTALAEGPAE
ncbi:MAG: hypothetical protein ACLFVO_25130, partial [Chloroflexaceae bacterium]